MSAPPLFRQEVLAARGARLHGEIGLAVPVPWQLIGFLLFATLLVALIFLSTAHYARVETVLGTIEPDLGVAAVVPTRPGVVSALFVRDGSTVRAGDPLARVSVEDSLPSGVALGARLVESYGRQDGQLASQIAAVEASGSAEIAVRRAQTAGLESEIAELTTQMAEQRRLIGSAEADVESSRSIAERGFLSKRDMRAREDALTARRQQLAQLNQLIGSKRSALAEAMRSVSAVQAQTRAQTSELESSRLDISQRLVSAEAARGFTLKAPVTGRVTSLTARLGSAVGGDRPLMMVVPAAAHLRAELRVPTSAIGQIETGQIVRLAIDAFPYQRFGTITGRVIDRAGAAVPVLQADGSTQPMYRVIVDIPDPGVHAFGERRPLIAGMTLTGRIVTRRQTLLQWLFEPLYAVGNR